MASREDRSIFHTVYASRREGGGAQGGDRTNAFPPIQVQRRFSLPATLSAKVAVEENRRDEKNLSLSPVHTMPRWTGGGALLISIVEYILTSLIAEHVCASVFVRYY